MINNNRFTTVDVEQSNTVPFNKWKELNEEKLNEIFFITKNNLKKFSNITIQDDKLYSNLLMLIYNTSFNKYKNYKLY